MNNKLEELLNKTNSNALNYDVNSDNLYLYAAITEPKSINKESLINFFGDNLYKPNKEGDYLTHLLCRNAFIGSLSHEKTTKLFSFIYELISPNLPGKTTCSSIMEFMICSLDRLEIKVEDYLAYLLNLHYLNKYDFSCQDSYGYNLSVYFLIPFILGNPDVMKVVSKNKVRYNFDDFLGWENGQSKKLYDECIEYSEYGEPGLINHVSIDTIIHLYETRKSQLISNFKLNEKFIKTYDYNKLRAMYKEYFDMVGFILDSYSYLSKSYSAFIKEEKNILLKLDKGDKKK